MQKKNNVKGRFYARLPDGDFLNMTIWRGRSVPNSEVIVVQVRRPKNGDWTTLCRLAVFRTPEGRYKQLPERHNLSEKRNK